MTLSTTSFDPTHPGATSYRPGRTLKTGDSPIGQYARPLTKASQTVQGPTNNPSGEDLNRDNSNIQIPTDTSNPLGTSLRSKSDQGGYQPQNSGSTDLEPNTSNDKANNYSTLPPDPEGQEPSNTLNVPKKNLFNGLLNQAQSSDPVDVPRGNGTGTTGGDIGVDHSPIASPGLACATKSCSVCGGCGTKPDLVSIASGREDIKKINEGELDRNQYTVLQIPADDNLITLVNYAKSDDPGRDWIGPSPQDQPVFLDQTNSSANQDPAHSQQQAGTQGSSVPPTSQSDPNFASSAPDASPSPAANAPSPQNPQDLNATPAGSAGPSSSTSPSIDTSPQDRGDNPRENDFSPQPSQPSPESNPRPQSSSGSQAQANQSSSDRSSPSTSSGSKCPFQQFLLAAQSVAQKITDAMDGIKNRVSNAAVNFGARFGLTSINQEQLAQKLGNVVKNDEREGMNEDAARDGQKPEPQNTVKSDDNQASFRNNPGTNTDNPAKPEPAQSLTNTSGIDREGNSTPPNNGINGNGTNNKSVNSVLVNRSPNLQQANLPSDQKLASQDSCSANVTPSVAQIKGRVFSLSAAKNSLPQAGWNNPQFSNGLGNYQNPFAKTAIARGANSPAQYQIDPKISLNSPINPIPTLASISNNSNTSVVPSDRFTLNGSNVAPANLKSQPQSSISGLNNPSSTLGDLNLNLSPRQAQIDSRITSLGTLSERFLAVARNLENLTSTKPLNPNSGNSSVVAQPQLNVAKLNRTPRPANSLGSGNSTTTPNLRQPTMILSRNQASSSQNLSMAQNPSASLALSPDNLSRSLVQVVANLRLSLSRNPTLTRSQLNLVASSNPQTPNSASQVKQLAARNLQAIAQSLSRLSSNFRRSDRITLASKVNVTSQASLRTTRSTQAALKAEALARVASNLKAKVSKSANLVTRANLAQIRQNSSIRLSALRQGIFRVVNQSSLTQANLGRKLSQTLSRLRYLSAQATSLKTRQASLKLRNLALVVKRNLNNPPSTLKASARSLKIQARLNLFSRPAESLGRILSTRFASLQRRLLAAKVITARATRLASQRKITEAVFRAGLFQRKITLPQPRLNVRKLELNLAKLETSQSWKKLQERFKLVQKTNQVKVKTAHLHKLLRNPKKALNSAYTKGSLSSWQHLIHRRDLITKFNSVAKVFLPLLLRTVNLISRLASHHPFWFFLLELVQRKDKKKDWFKNNKVFLAQFLYIFSLILKRLNKAGRKIESLSPQELFALVKKAFQRTLSSNPQQADFVSAKQSKGSKTIFAINKSTAPDKNLSIFQAKI